MRDWFADAFGSAIADVRQKLIEEGWFGRAVTQRPFDRTRSPDRESTFAQQTGWEMPADRRPQPEREHGIDR